MDTPTITSPNRPRRAGAHLRELLAQSAIPRNQVAALSGLSNPYIRELEKGRIRNVAREKLIALSVALNLDLDQIDELLVVFDRTGLTDGDVPVFVAAAGRMRFSKALHPVYDSYSLDLMLLSAEQFAGDHVVVSPRPTSCLRAIAHSLYLARNLTRRHPLYADLIAAIMEARRASLLANLERHTVDQYVCRDCLRTYVHNCSDETERDLRRDHIRNVIALLDTTPNFRLTLTTECPTFMLALKRPASDHDISAKLVLCAVPPHRHARRNSSFLAGFATDNPVVTRKISHDIGMFAAAAVPELQKRAALSDYLENLLRAG